MGRFFINKRDVNCGEVVISGAEARHIAEVMRLSPGDAITMFDGEGGEYSGLIKELDHGKKTLTVTIGEEKILSSEDRPFITLAQAIPKKNKMDLVVEKATELGVHRIIPMLTERTIVRPDHRSAVKMTERWRRIAVETSKQCARAFVPEISDVTVFKDIVATGKDYDLCFFACLEGNSVSIKKALPRPVPGNILVLIGPEGDFSPRESEYAENRGFSLISLGKRVLRSETAGLFVVSKIGYEGGSFDTPS